MVSWVRAKLAERLLLLWVLLLLLLVPVVVAIGEMGGSNGNRVDWALLEDGAVLGWTVVVPSLVVTFGDCRGENIGDLGDMSSSSVAAATDIRH
uniref:Secreted protein n=1 Tax=Anopheles darlingi TaxID=43151 RepID=A0A2M4D7Z2_ANODA